MKPRSKKKVPKLMSDWAAAAFLARDLSQLDFSQFKPARFEFEKKDEQINMHMPRPLLAALKARAKARGLPYTRFIRETSEHISPRPSRDCRASIPSKKEPRMGQPQAITKIDRAWLPFQRDQSPKKRRTSGSLQNHYQRT